MKRGSFAAGFLTCLLVVGVTTTAYAAGIVAERSTNRIVIDALPDLPYAFRSLDDYEFIDMEEPEHELSEKEKDFKPDKTE